MSSQELREINYKKVRSLVKRVKGETRLAWRLFKEADDRNDPLYKSVNELKQKVRELESTNQTLVARNDHLENVLAAIRETYDNQL